MLPYLDTKLSYEERTADLLRRLTLDEKIHMLSTHQCAVDRLGVREWYIGTECARGYVTHDNDRPSTVFPQPIGMASMFDPDLMEKIGEVAGNECRAYYNQEKNGGLMIFGPTVDMERDPRWGRTEEAYGEDPFLTGQMTIAYTKGLRGQEKVMKTIPTLKHFCANNNEKNRASCSANLEPRTKHEYYYAAFKPSVVKGGAYSMMAAYNELSGVPAICNPELQTIVKDEWGLGFVVSDGGDFTQTVTTHKFCESHAESLAYALKAGCDIMTDTESLVAASAYEALERGLINEQDIDRAVGNCLAGRFKLGEFDQTTPFDEISRDIVCCEESRKLNLLAAKEGITLLKNDGILPLNESKMKKLLVCGPVADENHRDWYTGYSEYQYSVLDGFRMSLGEERIVYDNGYDRIAIKSAATGKYMTVDDEGNVSCTAASVGEREIFEYRDYDFDVVTLFSVYAGKHLTFTDTVKAENEKVFQWFTTEIVHRRDYETYVTFESRTHDEVMTDETGRLCCRKKSRMVKEKLFEVELISRGADRIAQKAADVDAVIVCVGNHPLLVARECWDRPDITLPRAQQEITKAAFAANPACISLIISSYPYAVNWENKRLPAVVYTSHAGPELGTAVAACLLGEYNPAGRTPMTWYTSVRELPSIMDYDIIQNNVTYQYYDGTPLYPFGHGLSYAKFQYLSFRISQPKGNPLTAEIEVKNVSDVDGDEVVQVYYHFESDRIKRPIKKLCGFTRQHIKAGQTARIRIEIDRSELCFYDVSRERFCLETGEYTFMTGASSADIRLTEKVDIQGEIVPPRDLQTGTKAINYDRKGTVRMLWSKKFQKHFMQGAGYTPYLIYQNCCMNHVTGIELMVSSWERPETIRLYADTTENLIKELQVPLSDSIDGFRVITSEIRVPEGNHDFIIEIRGSICLFEFRFT